MDAPIHIDPEHPPIQAIRGLLLDAFVQPQDLLEFCYTRDAFRPVARGFAWPLELPAMALRLMQYCDTHNAWDELLAGVAEANPYQYARHTPRLREARPAIADGRREETRDVARPGIARLILDRLAPRLHTWLATRTGLLKSPPEWRALNEHLCTLRSTIENDIREKTYVEPHVKDLPESVSRLRSKRTGFLTPIQQMIKEIAGLSSGGDAQSAQISAISKKSKLVRDIVQRLLKAKEPLILLGDPGTGKSMTLQQAAMLIAERESKRQFPTVCLFIRLGEFRAADPVDGTTVWDYVKRSAPESIRPYLDSLGAAGRLVIFFDGMDEMSRERYDEYTAALSVFAGSRKGRTRTLFSCRITDFTPRFQHNRLVLLPFDRAHIHRYLKRQIPRFPLQVGGRSWTARKLANRLAQGDLPMQADNPFVLWLLCAYLQEEQDWPKSRVHLLEYYNRLNWKRKISDELRRAEGLPEMERAFLAWGRVALEITNRNQGAAIPLDDVRAVLGADDFSAVQAGKLCGVLQESMDLEVPLLRFEHHRFQEYFTAYYLDKDKEAKAAIRWLDKLDAPRWQETLFNLVLMGGGQEALNALNQAIKQGIKLLEPPPEGEAAAGGPRAETLLADRVELAARVLQQALKQSSQAIGELAETFRQAIYWLGEHGNPITQVKMLWAARIVPRIDVFQAARGALSSDVSWVREQALVVTAASSGPVGQSALKEDLFLSFASGRFLSRLGGYRHVAAALKDKRLWSILGVGVVLCLAQVALAGGLVLGARQVAVPAMRAAGMLHYEALARSSERALAEPAKHTAATLERVKKALATQAEWRAQFETVTAAAAEAVGSGWFAAATLGAMAATLLYMLARKSGRYVPAMLAAGGVCLLLPFLWWPIWQGHWIVLALNIGVAALPVCLAVLTGWAVAVLAHVLALAVFVAGAARWKEPVRKNRMLLDAMRDSYLSKTRWSEGLTYGVGMPAGWSAWVWVIVCLTALQWLLDWKAIGGHLNLFRSLPPALAGMLSAAIYLEAIGLAVSAGLGLRLGLRRKPGGREAAWMTLLIWTGVLVPLLIIGLAIWGLALVNWAAVWAFIVSLGLFPGWPPVVSVLVSAAIYFEIIALTVFVVRAIGRRYDGPGRAWRALRGWTAAWTGLALVMLAGWGLASIDWAAVLAFIVARLARFPFLPPLVNLALSVALYGEAITGAAALWVWLRKGWDYRRGTAFRNWSLVWLGLVGLALAGWGLAVISRYLARLIALILLAAAAGALMVFLWRIMGWLAPIIAVYFGGPSRSDAHDGGRWKQELQALGPESQAVFLRKTTAGALGLPVRDLLALLEEAEGYVKEEPALSEYWSKRNQIEQIIRQERVG